MFLICMQVFPSQRKLGNVEYICILHAVNISSKYYMLRHYSCYNNWWIQSASCPTLRYSHSKLVFIFKWVTILYWSNYNRSSTIMIAISIYIDIYIYFNTAGKYQHTGSKLQLLPMYYKGARDNGSYSRSLIDNSRRYSVTIYIVIQWTVLL